jgi:acyl carrier protein
MAFNHTPTTDSIARAVQFLQTEFSEKTKGCAIEPSTHLRNGLGLSSLDMLSAMASLEVLTGKTPEAQDLADVASLARFLGAHTS